MKKQRLQRSFAVLVAAGLVIAACGGDDDDTTADDPDDVTDDVTDDADDDDVDDADDDDVDDVDDDDVDEDEAPVTAPEREVTEVEEVEVDEGADLYGGSIAVGLEAEATGLRPWEDTCSSPCYNIIDAIYDRILEQNVDGEYQGFLAESIEASDDLTVWTVTLREGVTFHDGTPLTADTIVDMFALQQEGSQGSAQIASSGLESVEATGDLEVTYTLSQANSAFPAFLTRAPLGMVFQPEAAAADPDGFNFAPIGTGPFVIDSRDLDNETVVVRNDNYWLVDRNGNQLPYLDSIAFRPIPDEGTRLDALVSNTVDVMQTLRQGTIRDARVERDGGADIVLIEYQGNNTGGGMYNIFQPPFDDVRVRRGLTFLNAQEQVIEALGGTGISLPATQWFSPDSPWYSQAVADAWPNFDFEAGVALLAEYVEDPDRSDGLSVGSPIEVELSCPPDPTLIAAMQVNEQTWTASGLVDVNLTNFDQATHINRALESDHQAHCWRWSEDLDPALVLNPFVAPPTAEIAEEAGVPGVVSAQNFPNWWNPEAFEASRTAVTTDDFDERYELYERIMMLIAEEAPIWYSGHTAMAFGTTSQVQGLNSWHLPSGDLGTGVSPQVEGRYHEVFLTN